MSTQLDLVASAPGKLILMGEHAVVYGRPALVGALDRRLRVSFRTRRSPGVDLVLPVLERRISTTWSEIRDRTARTRRRWTRRFVDGEEGEELLRLGSEDLVLIALGEAADLAGIPHHGLVLRIDSEIPVGAGLGSSAALAVALCGGYLALRGHPTDPETIAELALEVERRQHGSPSGIDHHAVLHGGLLWAEGGPDGRLETESLTSEAPVLRYLRAFDSGPPEEPTGVVVDAVRKRKLVDEESVEDLFDRIEMATRSFREELHATDPGRALEAVHSCGRALEELGVVPREVRERTRRIEEKGGAAKISGAGSLSGPAAGSILVLHSRPERIATWELLDGWDSLDTTLPGEGFRIEEVP